MKILITSVLIYTGWITTEITQGNEQWLDHLLITSLFGLVVLFVRTTWKDIKEWQKQFAALFDALRLDVSKLDKAVALLHADVQALHEDQNPLRTQITRLSKVVTQLEIVCPFINPKSLHRHEG